MMYVLQSDGNDHDEIRYHPYQKLEIPTVVSMNPIMVDGTGMCGACRLMVGNEVKICLRRRTGV